MNNAQRKKSQISVPNGKPASRKYVLWAFWYETLAGYNTIADFPPSIDERLEKVELVLPANIQKQLRHTGVFVTVGPDP